jgi:hypothetical protein
MSIPKACRAVAIDKLYPCLLFMRYTAAADCNKDNQYSEGRQVPVGLISNLLGKKTAHTSCALLELFLGRGESSTDLAYQICQSILRTNLLLRYIPQAH